MLSPTANAGGAPVAATITRTSRNRMLSVSAAPETTFATGGPAANGSQLWIVGTQQGHDYAQRAGSSGSTECASISRRSARFDNVGTAIAISA